jgi:hypothetical protein
LPLGVYGARAERRSSREHRGRRDMNTPWGT